jgi:threonine dehydrogenase-like Zn-dependent dehydrogenase
MVPDPKTTLGDGPVMKAAVFDSAGRPLRVEQIDAPAPKADEILLRVAACGICGSDLHMSEDPTTFGVTQGAVLGHEFSGEVVALGSEVSDFQIGDKVAVAPMYGCGACERCRRGDPAWCANMQLIGGGYAELASVTARQCRKLPEGLSIEAGALAEPTAVALHCVNRGKVATGDRVLIVGAGPIGLLVAYWARRRGASCVAVADINEAPREIAGKVGATHFLRSGPDLADEFATVAGGPPDIVFECVGKPGLIDFCARLPRLQGRMVAVGLCVGGDQWDPFAIMHREVEIIFAAFFNMAEFQAALDALAEDGRFRPQALVTDTIGFETVPEVFEGLKSRTTQCKILIGTGTAPS